MSEHRNLYRKCSPSEIDLRHTQEKNENGKIKGGKYEKNRKKGKLKAKGQIYLNRLK